MPGSQTHWNDVYATKDESKVSWFEESPERSLRMIRATGVTPQDPIIDVGGGLSRLADALLGRALGTSRCLISRRRRSIG